ncbi:hypothetical protein AB4Y45_33445 [Paraburkholderia sp. EG287A]|uniref:hypothetical protein n=1 Tax=Paraburkholderia sp. EG287A TaxID=3237012 RepID=UPI0034D1F0C9
MDDSEFSMPLRTEEQINETRTRLELIGWVSRLGLTIATFGLMQWFSFSFRQDSVLDTVLAGLLLGTIISMVLLLLLSGSLNETELDPRQFEWLNPSLCASFAEFCEKNPGIQAYRDKVREAGRRFTVEEYSAMQDWVSAKEAAERAATQQVREREGCQKLYGIPVEQA